MHHRHVQAERSFALAGFRIRLIGVLALLLLISCTRAKPLEFHVNELKFDLTPEQVTQVCSAEKAKLLKDLDALEALPTASATFDNTVHALDLLITEMGNRTDSVLFLKYVSTDPKVRSAADKCETELEQLFVDVFAREKLFTAIKAGFEKSKTMDEPARTLADDFVSRFRRNGLELEPNQRKTFIEKKKLIVALEAEFNKELVEWKETLEATAEELKGLPDSLIQSLKKTPQGKYILTLSYPHYFPVMENAQSSELRSRMLKKFNLRGGQKNKERLSKVLKLRDETAKMLGFENHAAFVLERRMAESPKAAQNFLAELGGKLKALGEKNLQELLAAKKADLGAKATKVQPEDWRYYENQIRKNQYQVDSQKIREYFPIEKVIPGMFDIYQTLLGVTFAEDKAPPVWEKSVKRYRVQDKNGAVIAYFYMDLFPREGKYNHAAAFTLLKGYQNTAGKYQAPTAAIVANFSPPEGDRPSLLEHSEVETLFHEFGHIMHQVLTRAKYGCLSGTSVKRDFVEAPSQMLENWVWEKEPLTKLSGHFKTGEPLPDAEIQKLVAAKNVNNGIRYLRQLTLALLDLTYHTLPTVNTTKVYSKLSKEVMLIPVPEGTLPEASFSHLMGGYDAGYYGYLWSEVFAADMFTRFEQKGLLDAGVGADYRKWILEPGGQISPKALLKNFLGREPKMDAFLKELGLS
jgi:thimet oligopeptidase